MRFGKRSWAMVSAAVCVAVTAGLGFALGAPVSHALVVRQGDPFVLRLAPGQPTPSLVVFLDKTYQPIKAPGEQGALFLLGVDLDVAPGRVQALVRWADGREETLTVSVVKRDFPEERLSLPSAMVTPPRELEERIAREQALAAKVYRTAAVAQFWEGGFKPALDQPAAGNFGRRRILNGIRKSPHSGQDYKAPAGTPVKSIAGGKVRLARDLYYSGRTLLIDHGSGLVSQYMHLERMFVAEGETVVAGQIVGRVGSTGRATGPHLHLGVRLLEQRVDPESLWGLFPDGAR